MIGRRCHVRRRRGHWRIDGYEAILCRRDELCALHSLLLVALDVVVSQRLESLLLRADLVLEDLVLDRLFAQLLLFNLEILLQLLELLVEPFLVYLEVADLLALDLVPLTLLLHLLGLPVEGLLLDAVLVELFLQCVVLGDYFVVIVIEFGLLLIEFLFLLVLELHAGLNGAQFLGELPLLGSALDLEVLVRLPDPLLLDLPLVQLALVLLQRLVDLSGHPLAL